MKFIIAILIFSVIVLFHELGHFLLAKLNGIRVYEFALGLGPTLIGRKWGETTYALKLLPFGGECVMGEDEEAEDERSFGNKSVWARISVIAAGPIFNFIMAFIMAFIIISCIGADVPKISGVMEGYSAEAAGMQAGDTVIKMDNKSIHFYREVSMYSYFHEGETVDVTYERDGERHQVTLEPTYDEKSERYLLGLTYNYAREKKGILSNIKYSLYEVKYWIWSAVESLKMLVTGQVSANEVSGPVGIVRSIGDTYDASVSSGGFSVFINMLNIAILLTANLGVMNLLPLPALDGGRLVFLIIEAIRGKKIDQEKEGMVHFIGFILLMILMVVVLFNDIRQIFV